MIWLPCDEIALPAPRQGRRVHGYGGVALRGLVASSGGGGGAPGPDDWEPWQVWDDAAAQTSIDVQVEHWTSRLGGTARWSQTTDSRQPTLVSPDANINNEASLDFDSANFDRMHLNSADIPLADQSFFFDGSTSYRINLITRIDATAAEWFQITTSDGGFEIDISTSRVEARIWGTGGYASGAIAATPGGTITAGTWHYISVEYDAVGETLRVRVDGGTWASVSTSSLTHSANAATAEADLIGSGAVQGDAWVADFFVSKTLPDASRDADMASYYNTTYGVTT